MKFTEHMAQLIASRKAAAEPAAIWRYSSKLGGRALALDLQIGVPLLWSMFGPGGSEECPWACVIKPQSGSNSRGVLPLVRSGSMWRSLFGDGTRSWSSWQLWSIEEQERHQREGVEPYLQSWLCEELVMRRGRRRYRGGEDWLLPYDWKCYAIRGRVAWINQVDKTPSRDARTYRTRHWWRRGDELVPATERVILQERRAGELPRPRNVAGLLEAADIMAAALLERTGTPFVRLDFYEHDDGRIIFGEVTPHPSGGREVYTERADLELGRLWSVT